jgi:hypothetical protein
VNITNHTTDIREHTERPLVGWIERLWVPVRIRGLLGCFASHLRVIRHFQGPNAVPFLLVLEDDVLVDPKAFHFLHELMFSGQFTQPWDVISFNVAFTYDPKTASDNSSHFYGRPRFGFRSQQLGREVHLFPWKYGDWGTQALLYNGSSIGKVVDYLLGKDVQDVDVMLSNAGPLLNALVCTAAKWDTPVFMHSDTPWGSNVPKQN